MEVHKITNFMVKELEKIERLIEQRGIDTATLFRNGIEKKSIIDMFNTVKLNPTKELIQFYQWHDGVNYSDQPCWENCFHTFGGFFYPLNCSLDVYKEQVEIYRDYFDLFPIFSDDTVLIDLNFKSPTYGQLYFLCPSLLIIEPITAYDSLTLMIQTNAHCFENKLMYYDNEGYLEIDTDAVFAVS